jgi:hypothetical protein
VDLAAAERPGEAEAEQPRVAERVHDGEGEPSIELALVGVLRRQRRKVTRSGERISGCHGRTVPLGSSGPMDLVVRA